MSAAYDRVFAAVLGTRVFDFGPRAAEAAAVIAAGCQSIGRSMDVQDAMIAGIAAAHGATLATRNTRHFADAGIPLVDPWVATP